MVEILPQNNLGVWGLTHTRQSSGFTPLHYSWRTLGILWNAGDRTQIGRLQGKCLALYLLYYRSRPPIWGWGRTI